MPTAKSAEKLREGIFRRVSVRMWADSKIRALSAPQPCGQALWWHLIAGEHTGIMPGIFRVGEAAFAESLGWSRIAFGIAYREVYAEGLAEADWDARLVWVKNALRHNRPSSPKVILGWRTHWELLPECELKLKAWQHFSDSVEAMGEAWGKAFRKAILKPILKPIRYQVAGNREQVTDDLKSLVDSAESRADPLAAEVASTSLPAQPLLLLTPSAAPTDAAQVFAYWLTARKKPSTTLFSPERRRKVEARLKDFSVARICRAVDGIAASPHHRGENPAGVVYDDLELICRDAKHIETLEGYALSPPKAREQQQNGSHFLARPPEEPRTAGRKKLIP